MPPDLLDSRIAFETHWLRLRLDRLRLADGMEIEYGFIARPPYAIVAAVEDGAIWMVEQYRHPLQRRNWELPMGVAPDAATIEEAAATELREETGLRAERFDYVAEIAPAPALLAQTGALFLSTGLTQGETAREATEQDLVAKPWPIPDLYHAALAGRVRDAETLQALGLLPMTRLLGRTLRL